eukprot:CAMPEP_0171615414 /NCGR_PEP_ID=MMETSP0990-20121206/12882_1 /TAXON_ID=483369 /ORGANISM="non described non described, Strain CCMP2098" /LENGTH=57 /DNA_ID=CAMNT_0012179513 /DNA_START=52 /DNA_END=225 /DNA_ORIENTATION=+
MRDVLDPCLLFLAFLAAAVAAPPNKSMFSSDCEFADTADSDRLIDLDKENDFDWDKA